MKIQQLTDQDASFLYLETSETPQHVGGMSLVEPAPDYEGNFYEEYKEHIKQRIAHIPLLYRKLLPLPFDIDHPLWSEDADVDIDYHVRQLSVPRPGTFAQLEELVGRLHSNFLDRSRPLWEFYVIDGLESGKIAIYTKIHHAAMDGAASQVLVSTMYDPSPQPRALEAPPRHDLLQSALDLDTFMRGIGTHLVRNHIRSLQYLPELWKAWAKLTLPDAQTLRYDHTVVPPPPTHRTILNKAISSQRIYSARTLSLSAFKKIARQTGCKLNDVVLAVCSGALRRYLKLHKALPAQTLTTMVPVSLHEPGDTDTSNKNHVMVCSLATHIAEPLARLAAIHLSTTQQKRVIGDIRNVLLPDLSFVGAGALMRGAVDLYCRIKLADRIPPLANITISNVAGPPIPLYIVGARVLSFYPCSIPFHGSALNITVESYCDQLDFGLIACRRTVPDLPLVADYIVESLDELRAAVDARDAVQQAVAKPASARKPTAARKRSPSAEAPAPRPRSSRRKPSNPRKAD